MRDTKGVVDPVLANVPLFAALDSDGASALLSSMVEIHVPKGATVFVEGDEGESLYVIRQGKIKLGHAASDGRETLLAVLGPGEMFGELSFFDPGPRVSTATALTDATMASLSRSSLRPWLTGRPEVAEALLQAMAHRLRKTSEAMGDLVFTDVPGRVAKALLELSEKFGKDTQEGVLVAHDLTQEELAQFVGASRETVNKALADFASRSWIRIESRAVVILDSDRLAKRATR